jgi:hypothetical protein
VTAEVVDGELRVHFTEPVRGVAPARRSCCTTGPAWSARRPSRRRCGRRPGWPEPEEGA